MVGKTILLNINNEYFVVRFPFSSQMWVMPFILLNSLVAAVMTVVACMISVGFDNTCQSFKDITKKDR